jgi:hypothetical protein
MEISTYPLFLSWKLIDINLNILFINVNNSFKNYDANGVIVPGKSALLWQNFGKLGLF